jgi:hypothetical protein
VEEGSGLDDETKGDKGVTSEGVEGGKWKLTQTHELKQSHEVEQQGAKVGVKVGVTSKGVKGGAGAGAGVAVGPDFFVAIIGGGE